jgi:S-formylglutathione hydrolase FrmB
VLRVLTAITTALGMLLPAVASGAGDGPSSAPAGISASASATTNGSTGSTAEALEVAVPGGTREVRVYRPKGVDRADLPVVYFLHGVPGSDLEPEQAGVLDGLKTAFASGYAPFVLVVPDGNGSRQDTEWADSLDGRDRIESDVVDEIIPAVEGANVRDRAHRAIVGFSMGGNGAANIASRHPELFGQMVSIEGYFNTDDPSGVFGADPSTIVANSPDHHADALIHTRVMILDGTEDLEPACVGEAVRYSRILDAAGVYHEEVFAPGGHSWDFVDSQTHTWTAFLDGGWPAEFPRVDAATLI